MVLIVIKANRWGFVCSSRERGGVRGVGPRILLRLVTQCNLTFPSEEIAHDPLRQFLELRLPYRERLLRKLADWVERDGLLAPVRLDLSEMPDDIPF